MAHWGLMVVPGPSPISPIKPLVEVWGSDSWDERMNQMMEGRLDGRAAEWLNGQMAGWLAGQMAGWLADWLDGWMDGWVVRDV